MVKNLTLELELVDKSSSTEQESKPQVQYDTCPISIALAPGQVSSTILSAIPKAEGNYRLSYARWHLNEASLSTGMKDANFNTSSSSSSSSSSSTGLTMVTNRALSKKGKLLQKTLQQRANKTRGKPQFVQITVSSPQPLVNISLDLDQESPDGIYLLQGQFQHGLLILENKGGAAACGLEMKLSQTFLFVKVEEEEEDLASKNNASNETSLDPTDENKVNTPKSKYIEPLTPSGTSFEFPSDVTIKPGEIKKYKVVVRIENSGKQNMSLLLGYSKFEGNAADYRTSFASFDFYVFSSIVLSTRVAPLTVDTKKRILIVDIKSYLEADDVNKESTNQKSESGDKMFLSEAKDFEKLEEGSMFLENVFLMGAVTPDAEYQFKRDVLQKPIKTNEKMSVFMPTRLSMEEESQPSSEVNIIPQVSRVLKTSTSTVSSEERATNNSSSFNYTSSGDLELLLEKFSCVQLTDKKFNGELKVARMLKQEESNNAEGAGPRTISQVRRDRYIAQIIIFFLSLN